MTRRGSRWLTLGLMAGAGAGLLELPSVLNPASSLADDTALIMGYADTPVPMQSYVDDVMKYFIDPNYQGYSPSVVPTPEGGDYATVLPLGTTDLDTAIAAQLATPGNDVVVFGYSESTSIATQELANLESDPKYDAADLQFVLVEDLNNPDGGFLERFPALASTSFPATPADTPYETSIYNIEYSGSSDFPEYTSDLMADENAAVGFFDLHPFLLPGYPTGFNFSSISDAVSQQVGNTTYYTIPTQDLPMLDLMRALGGNAFADLIQPDMRLIIDQGYDWTGDPSVATPADFTAPTIDTTAADAYLAAGADQGVIAFLVDTGLLPQSDLSDLYPYVPDVAGLQAGALTDNAAALADASASASALSADLAASSSPFVQDLGTFLPGFATVLADFYTNFLNF